MIDLVCIVCPNGCNLKVDNSGKELKVQGHKCKRGIQFAQEELTNPTRTVCTTIKTIFEELPVVPVRTSKEIPKSKIIEMMDAVNRITIDKIYPRGYAIIKNILNTGVDIIVTSDMRKYI